MLETLILISISVFMNMTETSAEDAHCDNVWGGLSQERLSLKITGDAICLHDIPLLFVHKYNQEQMFSLLRSGHHDVDLSNMLKQQFCNRHGMTVSKPHQ